MINRWTVIVILLVIAIIVTAIIIVAAEPATPAVISPRDYGNGVYYFNCLPCSRGTCECDQEILGSSLSKFIGDNPNLVFVNMAPKIIGYGHTEGYFIKFSNVK